MGRKMAGRVLSMGLLVVLTQTIRAQWTQTSGPSGEAKSITALAASGDTIYAATQLCIFRSTNGGASWTAVNDGFKGRGENIVNLAVSGGNVFASFHSGVDVGHIYRSSDGGANWSAVNDGLPRNNPTQLAVSGSTVFAGTNIGLYMSENNGETWTEIQNRAVTALVASGGNLFFGTSDQSLFRYANRGAGWTLTKCSCTGVYFVSLCMSVGNVIAQVQDNSGAVSTIISTDTGTSWTALKKGFIDHYAVNGNTILAATDSCIYLSTNSGTDWTAVNTVLPKSMDYSCFAFSPNRIFAGTTKGVLRSTDSGKTWTEVNKGIASSSVKCFAVSHGNIFAGTECPKIGNGGGVFLSSNNGATWTDIYPRCVDALAISANAIFAGSFNNGLDRSTNDGASWSKADTGIKGCHMVRSLAVSGGILLAGTHGGGVSFSADNGTNWTSSGGPSWPVISLATNGSNIFAGTEGGGVFYTAGIGSKWVTVNNGGLTNMHVISLAAAGSALFAGTDSGAFLSTNNGVSWTALSNGLPVSYPVTSLVLSGGNLFAGIDGRGVFLSIDNGTNWKAVNTGLTNTFVLSLIESGGTLFAGTESGGVWSRPLSDMVGTAIQKPARSNAPREYLTIGFPGKPAALVIIEFFLPRSAQVDLAVHNLYGREIFSLGNKNFSPGPHRVAWDTRNVTTGCYVVSMHTESNRLMRNFTFIR